MGRPTTKRSKASLIVRTALTPTPLKTSRKGVQLARKAYAAALRSNNRSRIEACKDRLNVLVRPVRDALTIKRLLGKDYKKKQKAITLYEDLEKHTSALADRWYADKNKLNAYNFPPAKYVV